jgi:hypothetical protein
VKETKYIDLDFEYNNSRNRLLNLVCVAWRVRDTGERGRLWLHGEYWNKADFLNKCLNWHNAGYTFVAWAVTAEARSIETLIQEHILAGGVDNYKVYELRWIDLYLEWRMLTNHNARFCLGKNLINSRVVDVKQKVWRNDSVKAYKVEHNLAAGCYKLLGIRIDLDQKTNTREIILSEDAEYIEHFKEEILTYCESDVDHLEALHDRIVDIYKEELDHEDYVEQIDKWMLLRGDYAARTAEMEAIGYPIDYKATKGFSDSVPVILFKLQREINDLFPDIKPFKIDWSKGKATWNQKATREWIKSTGRKWRWTDPSSRHPQGQESLSFDAFADHFHARHSFPTDCFGSQIKRYLTFKRNLNGFLPAAKGASNFWDAVGDDERVRPYMGIFGSQSSRSQPKATGFLFLKSAWMRSLVAPAKGRAICGIDYGSEEFFLGGLMATVTFSEVAEGDHNMIAAYESGDPYSWFGIEAGSMPKGATKKSHPDIRDAFKSTVLALQYDMRDKSLAAKLEQDTGDRWTERMASKQSGMFKRVFAIFTKYRKLFVALASSVYQVSNDGWILFKDNPNPRSQGNWPIQTMGAVIMREAVRLAQDRGLNVIFTLHDALYIEFGSKDLKAPIILGECMQEAFQKCMETEKEIRLDYDIWSPDYAGKEEQIASHVKMKTGLDFAVKSIYVDPRGVDEYENFKQYFDFSIDGL